MTDRLTIVVAARNAGATIERAIRSCAGEQGCPLVLVDDHCTDDTVARAIAAAPSGLRVVRAPSPGGVPVARQCGLDAISTEFAAWLDGDDEWIPGRARRLVAALDTGHDVVVDPFELHDGASGRRLARLGVAPFLERPGGALRLFERNFLPGDTPVGFRVSTFRDAGGYDPAVFGPESYDLLLRAIVAGARFAWRHEVGCRIYAYSGSVSRDIGRQRAAVAAALAKHSYETVSALFEAAGYPSRVTAWALASMALHRGDPGRALAFLDAASPPDADPREILEPDGPWPFEEGWRRAFTRGVCLLMIGGSDDDAAAEFRRAEAIRVSAEAANNLGVAMARLDRPDEAHAWWSLAQARFPGYADARVNATKPSANRVTTHPLRRLASRADYDS